MEKCLLKKTLYAKLNSINKELSRLNSMKSYPNVDIKVISTKYDCLSQHKKDIEDIITICVDRNRF